MTIRVLIVDDHELIRSGLRGLLEGEDDIEVLEEASSVAEAMEAVERAKPDVAVLDIRLPDGTGIELCREIRSLHADVRCLFLTSFSDEQTLSDAVLAGAAGYLLKTTPSRELVAGVRRVAAGDTLIDPAAAARVFERLARDPGDPIERLTEREREILDRIAEGLTNHQIAQRMFLAEKTVKNHVSRVLSKLGLEHRTQAAVYALRRRGAKGDEPR